MSDTPEVLPPMFTEEAAESATPPPAPAPTPATPAPEVATSHQAAQFKLLMDKERSVRESEQRLKTNEGRLRLLDEVEALRQQNPLAAAQRMGLSPETLVRQMQQVPPRNPVQQLEARIQELTAKVEENQRREEDSKLNQVYEEAARNVTGYVQAARTPEGAEKFPFLKAAGAEGVVFERIREQYSKDGSMLSEEAAATELEKTYADIYAKLSKVGSVKQTAPVTQGSSTLTNQMQSQPAPMRSTASMSPEELLVEAVKVLRFEEVS